MATVETATLATGNTKTVAKNVKARNFQLTLNEVDLYNKLTDYLYSLKSLTYLIAAKEKAPTTGHEHIHVFIHFKNAIKLSIKKCCNAHVEICRGTPQENIKYIEKDGNIIEEFGERPKQGGYKVKDLKELTEPDGLDWKMFNTWQKIHQNDEIDINDFGKSVKVFYIQGPSGIGKTEKAKEIIKSNGYKKFSNAKYENGFWSGVGSNREVLLYDDFRDSHMKASEFINLIDYNKHTMNLKGSHCSNDYKLIIITSVQRIEHLYSNMSEEPRIQWMRRVEIINMYDLTPSDSEEEI